MQKLRYAMLANAAAVVVANKPRQWFRMEKKTGGEYDAEILIYDQIGASFWNDNAVSAKQFDTELKALGDVKKVLLRINSPGGDAFDGLAIYTTLNNHPAEITARVDGIAASAASLVAMAADKIIMPKNTFLLIHEPSGGAWGTASDMEAMANDLKTMTESFAVTYAERSGQGADEVKMLMSKDRLMSATEASELGYCDELDEKEVKMVATFDMSRLSAELQKQLKPIMSPAVPPKQTTSGGKKKPALRTVSSTPEDQVKRIKDIAQVCTLARRPDLLGMFADSEMSIEEVRTMLQRTRAKTAEENEIDNHVTADLIDPVEDQIKSAMNQAITAHNNKPQFAAVGRK